MSHLPLDGCVRVCSVSHQAGQLPFGPPPFYVLGYTPLTHEPSPVHFEPHCYPCTPTLTSFPPLLAFPIPHLHHTLLFPPPAMKRNSTTSSSRRRADRPSPSLESPTLQPSTSSRSRVHRDGFSYHWIFRSNIPKRPSLLFPNEIQKRNFFGMGEVFGVLANVRLLIRPENIPQTISYFTHSPHKPSNP